MYLASLSLQGFRNYKKRTFGFDKKTTLIVGNNGSGKTNILEALYLLATGTSFRAQRIEEMILFDEELARVSAELENQLTGEQPQASEASALEVVLTRGELGGKRVAKRHFSVDGASRRITDFVGRLVVVLFRPEDLELILGSPVQRRTFLDEVLLQVDREYRRSLVSYEKALARRNKLLDAIREGQAARSQLAFWDQLLIKHGQILTQRRSEFIEFVNRTESDIDSFQVVYDSSAISTKRLLKYAEQEVALGYTLVGPHKDDFVVLTDSEKQAIGSRKGRDLALYGARGEQRLAVLWLKLAALEFVSDKIGGRPVLLLDDIFSELDREHREKVIKILSRQQTIITTTDLGLIESKYRDTFRIMSLD